MDESLQQIVSSSQLKIITVHGARHSEPSLRQTAPMLRQTTVPCEANRSAALRKCYVWHCGARLTTASGRQKACSGLQHDRSLAAEPGVRHHTHGLTGANGVSLWPK